MNIVLLILLAILMSLNMIATWVSINSPCFVKKQKLFQIALIWLVPILGFILVWSLAASLSGERVTTDFSGRNGNDDGNIRLDNYTSDGGGDGSSD